MLVGIAHRHGSILIMTLLITSAGLLSGCAGFGSQPSGELAIRNRLDASQISQAGFEHASYNFDGPNNITVVAYAGPKEQPSRAVVIRMFWRPKAGRTPIDSNATNATMHYVIFDGESASEVDIYSGAGFVFPKQKLGEGRLNLGVWQADLRLSNAEVDADPSSSQAHLEGWITAVRDDAGTEQMIRTLNHRIRDVTGTVRMVQFDADAADQPQS